MGPSHPENKNHKEQLAGENDFSIAHTGIRLGTGLARGHFTPPKLGCNQPHRTCPQVKGGCRHFRGWACPRATSSAPSWVHHRGAPRSLTCHE